MSGNLLIPLLPGRIGPKRFKAVIDGLMRSGNAWFIEKNGRAADGREHQRERHNSRAASSVPSVPHRTAKQIKRGQEIPIAVLVKRVDLKRRLNLAGGVTCTACLGAGDSTRTGQSLMASNRAQILISAVDQTKSAFDSIKRGWAGLTDTAKSVNGVLANLGVGVRWRV